ncbi:hypothetical protein [Thiolapillus sp.]|uniref:globin domain-containing protein n=1 Tax=Thiolapillus sp. TaxID=2017437 RepID=UPI003AF4EB4F
MRHAPFAIGPEETEQWLLCMDKALSEISMPDDLRQNLGRALRQLALHMINQG